MGFFWKTAVEEIDERGKTFHWAREKRIWIHLSAFLAFSVVIHGSGFYLFKVVYPSPVRVEPRPDGILVIEPDDPESRSVLQRLADRTVYLSAPSTDSDTRVSLDARTVHFTPAFQRAEMEPIPPPALAEGPGAIETLPPAPAGAGGASERLKIDPALSARGRAPWSLLGDYLALADSLPRTRFAIEVAPDGSVRVTEATGELGDVEKRELTAVVESTLRFLPAEESVSAWVEIGGTGG